MSAVVLLALAAAAVPEIAEPLDLERAVDLALAKNERPAIALTRVAEAQALLRTAWSQLLPTVSLRGTYRRRAFEVAPQLGSGETAVIQALNALNAEGAIQSTLFDASAIPDIQAAAIRAEAAEQNAVEAARTLAFETAEAFLAALTAERTAEAARRRLALAAATSSNAAARFDAGLAARSEVYRTDLDRLEAAQTRTEAERAARLSRIALGFLMGAVPEGPLRPPKPGVVAPKAPEALALEDRPDLLAARLVLEAAERAAWAPWLSMIPSLGLDASLRATNETGFQDRVFNWDIALTLTWVLYDGGARYARADLLDAQAESARLELSLLERQATMQVKRAAAELSANLGVVEQAERRQQIAEQTRKEVTERFRQGLATALEETDAATSAFEAAVALERARFDVARAALALTEASGGWPTAARP